MKKLNDLFVIISNITNKMPEGPEVLTITDMMDFYMTNRVVDSLKFISGKHSDDPPDNYDLFSSSLPLTIDKVFCKGKLIIIQLHNDETKWWITNHLVMTGSWRITVPNCDKKYVRCKINFVDESEEEKLRSPSETSVGTSENSLLIPSINFLDIRDLGKFQFINDEEILDDILSELKDGFIGDYKIDYDTFKNNIKRCKSGSLISKLRDGKSICSGIGNYLISEIMYDAGFSYLLKCDELSNSDIKTLYKSCKNIIELSYENGGLSIENYVDINGDKGNFEQYLRVYRKDGKNGRGNTDPYGNKVLSIKKGQTFWYVPGLQRYNQ